jgi:hypothetical protein
LQLQEHHAGGRRLVPVRMYKSEHKGTRSRGCSATRAPNCGGLSRYATRAISLEIYQLQLGHCEIQLRPLRVKTGQYRTGGAVLIRAIIRYLTGAISAWHILLRQGGAALLVCGFFFVEPPMAVWADDEGAGGGIVRIGNEFEYKARAPEHAEKIKIAEDPYT